jgi:hypothetical protein
MALGSYFLIERPFLALRYRSPRSAVAAGKTSPAIPVNNPEA